MAGQPFLEVSTVADDEVVAHVPAGADGAGSPARVVRLAGLAPGTENDVGGVAVRTLHRPSGERLATIATVNDLHFGEVECGKLEGVAGGPILRSEPGEAPYPETMNRAAAREISDLKPDAVVAKGDLTDGGRPEEMEAFLACYQTAFGDRLHYVRGNHDAMSGGEVGMGAPFEVALPGARLAVLDTVIAGIDSGRVDRGQLEWLDELGQRSDAPVIVVGHHHPWDPSSPTRPEGYFGINPDDSEALVAVFARRPSLVAYLAGHTHRNRIRHFAATGEVPWVEVACTKDYPGSWAEYRVFEGGILQVHRRISAPEALEWSERCRALFEGVYPQYALGGVEDRCTTLWTTGG